MPTEIFLHNLAAHEFSLAELGATGRTQRLVLIAVVIALVTLSFEHVVIFMFGWWRFPCPIRRFHLLALRLDLVFRIEMYAVRIRIGFGLFFLQLEDLVYLS